MLASSRTPQRRRRSRRAVVSTGALMLALAGCTGGSPSDQTDPTYQATPLAGYDTSDLTLVPGEFCDRVPAGAITAALGSDSTESDAWQPGTRLPGSKDISNEFGCSWSTPTVTAQAWIFATPVSRERAADFAKEVVGPKCRPLTGAPAMGDPGTSQICELNTASVLTSFYGLVGDAWVGCEVVFGPLSSSRPFGLVEPARVGEWCVAVLEAIGTT